MPSGQLATEFTGDDAKLLRALKRTEARVAGLEAKLKTTGKAGDTTGKKLDRAGQKGRQAFGGANYCFVCQKKHRPAAGKVAAR